MNDMNDWNRAIIEEFRANGGKVGGPFEGGTLCSSPQPAPNRAGRIPRR